MSRWHLLGQTQESLGGGCLSRCGEWGPCLGLALLENSTFHDSNVPRLKCIMSLILTGAGLPWWFKWQCINLPCRRPGFNPWAGKIPRRRKWQPTSACLLAEFHEQRRLAGYSSWGCKELDMTELLTHTNTHTSSQGLPFVQCAKCSTQSIHWLFIQKGKLRQRAGPRVETPTQDHQALSSLFFSVHVSPPWLCDTQSPQMPFQILPPDLWTWLTGDRWYLLDGWGNWSQDWGEWPWVPQQGRPRLCPLSPPPGKKWASLVAQMVKRLPAMRVTWVQSLGWEDPLEKKTATHSSILVSRIPRTEEVPVHGVTKSWTQLSDFTGKKQDERRSEWAWPRRSSRLIHLPSWNIYLRTPFNQDMP